MGQSKNNRIKFIAVSVLLLLLIVLSISTGSVYIHPADIWLSLHTTDLTNTSTIVINYRLPKMLTVIFAGAALSFSGLQMQTLFRNPLAGPYVLGISSGASLGVAILVLSGVSISFLNSLNTTVAAIAGSSLVLLIIILVSVKLKDSLSLLIIGIMVGAFSSAIVGVIQYLSSAESIQQYLFWSFGSTGNLGWNDLSFFIPIIIIGLLIGFSQAKPLNALLMGESYAFSLGIKTEQVRLLLVISVAILAGVVTAFCGPIAFVGLAVPHIAKMIFKTADHFIIIPGTLLLGAVVLLLCDIIAQLPGVDLILPINAITSLVGAPIVIWLILKGKNLGRNFG